MRMNKTEKKREHRGRLHLFLLRHGKPEFPDERSYLYGHTDYPLSGEGEAQARKLGAALSGIPMQRIVSSDLARAAQTADIVAGLQKNGAGAVARDPALREIDMGEWDGVPKEEVTEQYADVFQARGADLVGISAPGGETFLQLQARGLKALDRIVVDSAGLQRVLLVAHGGIFWSIISGLFDIPLGDMLRFGLDYCALHLLDYDADGTRPGGGYRLLRYNWSPDLLDYMDYPIQ